MGGPAEACGRRVACNLHGAVGRSVPSCPAPSLTVRLPPKALGPRGPSNATRELGDGDRNPGCSPAVTQRHFPPRCFLSLPPVISTQSTAGFAPH